MVCCDRSRSSLSHYCIFHGNVSKTCNHYQLRWHGLASIRTRQIETVVGRLALTHKQNSISARSGHLNVNKNSAAWRLCSAMASTHSYETAGPCWNPGLGESQCSRPSCNFSLFGQVYKMCTWENLRKVNCEDMIVTPALCASCFKG